MLRSGQQYKLLDTEAQLENGFIYEPGFISSLEEDALSRWIEDVELLHAGGPHGAYDAKRRYADFGSEGVLPKKLQPIADRIEERLDLSAGSIVQALVNEYRPGTALGWHVDNEPFDIIAGISLGGWAMMRLRPLGRKGAAQAAMLSFELEPRSLYIIEGEARWRWQHSVAPSRTLRYSVTFRTALHPQRDDSRDSC